MSELPLFPLQTVLLPEGRLALRVFETRYVDMVARCLRGENRFGVIAIREGAEVGSATTFERGTSAQIVDWLEESRGLLGILAVGRTPFRLRASRRETAIPVSSTDAPCAARDRRRPITARATPSVRTTAQSADRVAARCRARSHAVRSAVPRASIYRAKVAHRLCLVLDAQTITQKARVHEYLSRDRQPPGRPSTDRQVRGRSMTTRPQT
jgi:Lon protease-like protein